MTSKKTKVREDLQSSDMGDDAGSSTKRRHKPAGQERGESTRTTQPPPAPLLPDSTFGLLKVVVLGAFNNIPRIMRNFLFKGLIAFLIAYAVNFYVVAVKNNGLGMSLPENSPWYPLLNIGQNQAAFSALCFLTFFVLSTLFERIRSRGLKAFFKDLAGIPAWTAKSAHEAGKFALPFLLISAGLTLFLSLLIRNRYIFATFAVGLFFAYTAKTADFTIVFAKVIWADLQKVFRQKKRQIEANVGALSLFILGTTLGCIGLVFLPKQPLVPVIAGFVLIVLGVMISRQKASPQAALFSMSIILTGLLVFSITATVRADDGGWYEGGARWLSYIRSPGAWAVLRNGLFPGFMAVAGSLIGSIFSAGYEAISSTANSVYEGIKSAGESLVEGVTAVGEQVSNAVSEVGSSMEYAWDVASGTVSGTVGQIVDTAVHVIDRGWTEANEVAAGFFDGCFELSEDQGLWDGWFDNMYTDLSQMGDSFGNFAGTVWDTTKDYADLAWSGVSSWETFRDGLGGTLDDIGYGLSTSAGWLSDEAVNSWNNPDNFWDRVYSGTQTAGDVLGNVWNAVSDTVNNPENVYQTIKDMLGADNFSNSWDPNRSGWDRTGQALWGTFELGGAISSVQEAGQGITRFVDDIHGGLADDVVRGLADDTARGLSDDAARSLGDQGMFIHTRTVDPDFIPNPAKQTLSDIAREMDVQIQVRLGNADSVRWFDEGLGVPKPLEIKSKTINYLDEMLGCPEGSRGVVGYYRPTLPDKIDEMEKTLQSALRSRFDQRVQEIADYGSDMNRMMQEGRYSVVNGMVYDVNAQKFVAGDLDLYHMTRGDGSPLPDSMIREIENRLTGTPDSNVLHRSVTQQGLPEDVFNPAVQDKYIRGGTTRGEGVISFNADGSVTQAYARHDFYQRPAPDNFLADSYGTAQTVKVGLSGNTSQ